MFRIEDVQNPDARPQPRRENSDPKNVDMLPGVELQRCLFFPHFLLLGTWEADIGQVVVDG